MNEVVITIMMLVTLLISFKYAWRYLARKLKKYPLTSEGFKGC